MLGKIKNLNMDNWIFVSLPIVMFMPKMLQTVVYVLILLGYFCKYTYVRNKVSDAFVILSMVNFFSIGLYLLNNECELSRILAGINTALLWLIAALFLNFYLHEIKTLSFETVASKLLLISKILMIIYVISFVFQINELVIPFYKTFTLWRVDYAFNKSIMRFVGGLDYPNLVAEYILISYPIIMVYFNRDKNANREKSIVYSVLLMIMMISAQSRLGIVLFLIDFCMTLGYIYREQFVVLVNRIVEKIKCNRYLKWLMIVVTILLIPLCYKFIVVMVSMKAGSSSTRFLLYKSSIEHWLSQSVLFGAGIKIMKGSIPLGSHSTILGVLYKTGVVGFAIFLVGIYELIKNVKSLLNKKCHELVYIFLAFSVFFLMLLMEDLDGVSWLIVLFFSLCGYIINYYGNSFENVRNSDNRSYLFLVNTPMQLLNAAILSQTEFSEKKCDIYYTSNVKKQAQKLCENGFFANVYEISLVEDRCSRGNAIGRMLVRIMNALDLGKIKKSLPSNPFMYERVFAAGVSLRNYEIYYAIKSFNKSVKFSLYEEGICEYYYMAKKDYGKILFSYLFFQRYYLHDCDSLYVHSPEMVSIAWKNIRICKIPDIMSESMLRILSHVMGYTEELLKDEKDCVVVLDQAFYNEENEEYQRRIVKMLAEVYPANKIYIKLHPRSTKYKYGTGYNYIETAAPFEIVILNEELSSHTFVSIASSSILNFKLMFNMEPRIILLNQMDSSGKEATEFDKLVSRIQKGCKKSNLYLPSSEEEFLRVIQNR